jgi:hypothetical protein
MLFCKSSTVNVGTIALICTASCVVATIASFVIESGVGTAAHSSKRRMSEANSDTS